MLVFLWREESDKVRTYYMSFYFHIAGGSLEIEE